MRFPFVMALVLASSAACSNPEKARCAKEVECCAQTTQCTTTNATGFEDRCTISENEQIDELGTYGQKVCDDIVTAMQNLDACLGGISCDDIATGLLGVTNHVAKCDSMQVALCNAQVASGDACGQNYVANKLLGCDNATASLSY